MSDVRTLSYDDFDAELRGQGVSSRWHAAFVCPACGTVQSAQSLIDAGASSEEVGKYLGFSCVGRWTGAPAHRRGDAPGKGCDWTLGGLFKIHKLEVVTPDGVHHPSFEVASPEQAQKLEQGA